MTTKIVRAIAEGKLFDGLVDCYVLEDGRGMIAQRGAVFALTNGGSKHGDFGRFVARIPGFSSGSVAVANFSTSDCGEAHGITSGDFVAVLNAYVDAGLAGTLRKNQAHLAVNAQKILRSLQAVGLDAVIDEATGHQRHRAGDALARRFAEYLRDSASSHEVTFKEKLVRELHRVYGKTYRQGRHPRWLASVNSKVYRTIFGDEIVGELKARNPEPHFGSNHHQFVSDDKRPFMRDDVEVMFVLARTSQDAADFWKRCEYHFKRTPMRLDIAGAE
jgi:hypothetical protein